MNILIIEIFETKKKNISLIVAVVKFIATLWCDSKELVVLLVSKKVACKHVIVKHSLIADAIIHYTD